MIVFSLTRSAELSIILLWLFALCSLARDSWSFTTLSRDRGVASAGRGGFAFYYDVVGFVDGFTVLEESCAVDVGLDAFLGLSVGSWIGSLMLAAITTSLAAGSGVFLITSAACCFAALSTPL